MSSSLPRRHTASQKIFFLISKRKAGMLNMYIFVNIYVLRIWILSCLQCWNISYVEGFSFWMLCFWNETFLSYLSRLRAGLFSNSCFFSTWLLKCVWDSAACLWCLKTCRWIKCFNAFMFRVNHSAFSFKENTICKVFKIKTFHNLWLQNTAWEL